MINTKHLFRGLILAACMGVIVPSYAATPVLPASAPAAEVEEDNIPEKSITVEMSKGKLIRLNAPASAVIAADPTIADVQVVSPSLVYINGKSVGETTVFAVDSKDNEILRAVVTVTHNISKLNKTIKEMVPDAKVSFQSVDNALVMNGSVDSPLQAEDVRRLAAPFVKTGTLVNMIRPLGSNQVMLKVKIAEVDRSETKNFGINLQNLSSPNNFLFGVFQGRSVLSTTTNPVTTATATSTVTQSTTGNTIFGGFNDGQNSINAVIDALEDNGLVTTLAEPTLTTQSGQSASFLAGGEIPVPSVTGSGTSAQVSVNYQPFGVSLNFTPVVLSKDRISLTVSPEVSSIAATGGVTDAGFNIPALQTRKASTTVELGSGQSFSIAGLIQNDHNNDINKFPFLGDVPVLGMLFRSSSFQHNQTELVIIVTPYIVGAVDSAKALHDPTEGLVLSNDAERILLGKLYHDHSPTEDQPQPDPVDTPKLNGPIGYVLK